MLILENLPAEQAHDFLSRSWVPQNFHMYYSAKEISRQCTEDFTADITERASSEFGAGVSRSYKSSSTEPIQLHTYARHTRLGQ